MPSTQTAQDVLNAVRRAWRSEPRIGPKAPHGNLEFDAGTLTLEGEMPDIAAKKLALELAAAVPGVTGIIDRLHVAPAERLEDGEVRDLVRRALEQEPAFAELALSEIAKGEEQTLREPAERKRGWIRLSVAEGVVTLDGEVPGLEFKRLAGVLAWWVPGSRDVVNGLGVTPEEPDNDAEITGAVRMALEKDPFVNAGQVIVGTVDAVVTLAGLVPSESEREMAEYDAWYVFGVDRVHNKIEVAPFAAG
ncbi:BON domain-containing protein [Pelagibius marinus]|uniref:BON domain-containing protein n=1 Tax=Pelagibius marinus TaxID=2762760 RepID=UPI001872CEE8|nr:BON domain-containing protein [Pelagibius marinus]